MKSVTLTVLILCTSLVQASDLIVDWSLDLRNPDQYLSPPLHLVCIATTTCYSIGGTPEPGDGKALHRYRLPEEVVGRCILSLDGGMEPKWTDGSHQIDINDPKGLVQTKMPGTSASFEFKLPGEAKGLGKLELHLFKLSTKGMPLPEWGYVTAFNAIADDQVVTKKFIIPFAGAGEYLAYVAEVSDEKGPRYFYAKQFSVTKDNLITHDQQSTIDDLQSDMRKTIVQFQPKDAFSGLVAVAFVNKELMRHVRVNRDGAIIQE